MYPYVPHVPPPTLVVHGVFAKRRDVLDESVRATLFCFGWLKRVGGLQFGVSVSAVGCLSAHCGRRGSGLKGACPAGPAWGNLKPISGFRHGIMRVKEMRADLLGYRAAIRVDATQIVQAEQPNTSKAFTKLADRLKTAEYRARSVKHRVNSRSERPRASIPSQLSQVISLSCA